MLQKILLTVWLDIDPPMSPSFFTDDDDKLLLIISMESECVDGWNQRAWWHEV